MDENVSKKLFLYSSTKSHISNKLFFYSEGRHFIDIYVICNNNNNNNDDNNNFSISLRCGSTK
jgi:hypothetical protein